MIFVINFTDYPSQKAVNRDEIRTGHDSFDWTAKIDGFGQICSTIYRSLRGVGVAHYTGVKKILRNIDNNKKKSKVI